MTEKEKKERRSIWRKHNRNRKIRKEEMKKTLQEKKIDDAKPVFCFRNILFGKEVQFIE